MRIKERYCYSNFAGNLRLVSLKDGGCKPLAKEYSKDIWIASHNIYFAECSSFRNYGGHTKNDINEVTEFINLQDTDNPVILKDFGYLFLSYEKGTISKSCCLFLDFKDYVAFLSFQKKIIPSIPKQCDCFILSHVSNFISMVASTDDYSNIFMFFPNNDTGKTMAQTIKHRNPKHTRDCSMLYASDNTLHEYCNRLLD